MRLLKPVDSSWEWKIEEDKVVYVRISSARILVRIAGERAKVPTTEWKDLDVPAVKKRLGHLDIPQPLMGELVVDICEAIRGLGI